MGRFKLGTCEWSMKARGRALLEVIRRTGLECVQLGVGTEIFSGKGLADPAVVEEYRNSSADLGVEIISLSPQFVDNHSFTLPQSDQDAEIALQLCKRTIDCIPVFGCQQFLLPVLGKNTISNGSSFHRAVNYIRELAGRAAAFGAETYLEINLSIKQTYDLLDAVDRPDVKIFFDSQNLFALDGTAMAGYFTELAAHDLVGGVHVKDGIGTMLSGSLLGEGNSGFVKTARAIVESKYDGCILTESVYANPTVANLGTEEELLALDAATMRRYFW